MPDLRCTVIQNLKFCSKIQIPKNFNFRVKIAQKLQNIYFKNLNLWTIFAVLYHCEDVRAVPATSRKDNGNQHASIEQWSIFDEVLYCKEAFPSHFTFLPFWPRHLIYCYSTAGGDPSRPSMGRQAFSCPIQTMPTSLAPYPLEVYPGE